MGCGSFPIVESGLFGAHMTSSKPPLSAGWRARLSFPAGFSFFWRFAQQPVRQSWDFPTDWLGKTHYFQQPVREVGQFSAQFRTDACGRGRKCFFPKIDIFFWRAV